MLVYNNNAYHTIEEGSTVMQFESSGDSKAVVLQ